jgi:ArsR family transcriptional regulator, arsenate/arsenite/antimonite-responsive transcriptional repressor
MKAAADKLSLALRAVADPTRRRILRLLHPGTPRKAAAPERPRPAAQRNPSPSEGWTASDVEQRIKLAQPTISHHMKILKNAGLIETQKQGTWVRYRRIESAIRALRKGLLEEL